MKKPGPIISTIQMEYNLCTSSAFGLHTSTNPMNYYVVKTVHISQFLITN